MKLSKHFTLQEFLASQISERQGFTEQFEPSPEIIKNLTYLAERLEDVRTLLSTPMYISSGFRCHDLNHFLGSKRTSSHTQGLAVDFCTLDSRTPSDIVSLIVNSDIEYDQVIQEFYNEKVVGSGWVHLSFHPEHPRNQALIIDKKGVRPFEDTIT